MKNYLDSFDWHEVEVIKLFGTGLQDQQFNELLNYILDTRVHSLLLVSNDLQEISLDALINFTNLNSCLKTVSLQKNNINKLNRRVRAKIARIQEKGVNLYI